MTWSFQNSGALPGAENMRLDEQHALALGNDRGVQLVRVFRWQPWAISIGYNQRADELLVSRAAAEGIDIVRRPTGGRAILHAEELTYSVVMAAGRGGVLQVYSDISAALVAGLRLFGVEVSLQKSQPNFAEAYRHASSIPCFTSSARYEIEWNGRKLVGSAQRRFAGEQRDVILQHGSILCGPAHKRLSEYLLLEDPAVRARIRRELEERTVDLSEVTGGPVDVARLATCIRRGFEEAWNISFVEGTDTIVNCEFPIHNSQLDREPGGHQ